MRFYAQNAVGTYVPDYVTVNSTLPANGDGSLAVRRGGRRRRSGCPCWRRPMPSGTRRATRAATARTPMPPFPAAVRPRWTSRSSARRDDDQPGGRRPGGGADRHRRPPGRRGGDGGDLVDSDAALFNQLSLVNQHGYEVAGYDAASQTSC